MEGFGAATKWEPGRTEGALGLIVPAAVVKSAPRVGRTMMNLGIDGEDDDENPGVAKGREPKTT